MKTNYQTQGGVMNYKTPVSLLLSVVVWFAFLSAPAHGAAGEGKYHLVYLVSAEKVEVEAKAYVEPLFFTDGKEVKSFYDYCRQYHHGAKTIPSESEIADDTTPLHEYCSNRPLTLFGKNYFTLNNEGASVALDTIVFKSSVDDPTFLVPPLLPLTGAAIVAAVSSESATPPMQVTQNNGPQYYFLMSGSKSLIERIVPVKRYEKERMEPLLHRAREYAETIKGRTRTWRFEWERKNGPIRTVFDERGTAAGLEDVRPQIIAPLFADIDNDKVVDIIFGMRAVVTGAAMNKNRHPSRFMWDGVGVIPSASKSFFVGDRVQFGTLETLLSEGYVHNVPMLLLRTGACTYLLLAHYQTEKSYDLMTLPTESSVCRYQRITKKPLDADNRLPPY